MGVMFFQEFYGEFYNTYTQTDIQNYTVLQTSEIFISQDAIGSPYIGNQTLPTGANPFINKALPFEFTAAVNTENYMVSILGSIN